MVADVAHFPEGGRRRNSTDDYVGYYFTPEGNKYEDEVSTPKGWYGFVKKDVLKFEGVGQNDEAVFIVMSTYEPEHLTNDFIKFAPPDNWDLGNPNGACAWRIQLAPEWDKPECWIKLFAPFGKDT